MAYTVPEIITWAKIAQPLSRIGEAKKKYFKGKSDADLDIKLYITRRDVEYEYSQIVAGANAFSLVTITDVGNDGDTIQAIVNDPDLGDISLGVYTKQSSDTTTTILAASIASNWNGNSYGYSVLSANTVITITARTGLGDTINGSNLRLVIVPTIIPLSGLINWYKSDTGVTGTTQVTSWADQSGNSNNLSYNTSLFAELALSIINGYPVIKKPSSTNAWLVSSGTIPDNITSGMTIFLVGSQSSESSNGVFLAVGVGLDIGIFRTASSSKISEKMRSAASVSSNETITDGVFYTVRATWDGISTQDISINNGTPHTGTPTVGSYTPAILNLFSLSGGSFGNKQIAELIIYSRLLTPTEITQVELYLKTKYNHY